MPKNGILFAWIGMTDLKASRGEMGTSLGPTGQALEKRSFSHLVLISDHAAEIENSYISWVKSKFAIPITKSHVKLTSPTRYDEIYPAAKQAVETALAKQGKNQKLTFHVSPGTPAMAAVWVILAKTTYPAELIESSPQAGVQTVSFPFDISAEYLPDSLKRSGDELLKLIQGLPPEAPEFVFIIHRCQQMKKLIAQARRLSVHDDVPVVIQGESGTGKELFARAIHQSSPRKDKPFIAVNCGAIPLELVEAELFGYKKGSFTGASQDHDGYFFAADSGTLFLDEIGELPLSAQVKMLRTIQEGSVTRIGTTKPQKINVRIIAATNRNLIDEMTARRFREDLFHRIAVGVLKLPPLRERHGDLNPLIDFILEGINKKFEGKPGWKHKKLSAGARNLLHQHPWPGNIRELSNTLSRASIWTPDETLDTEDIRESLLSLKTGPDHDQILNRELGNGFILPEVLSEVSTHYLKRAVSEGKGNKSLMAKLVGLPNYQTLSNWLKKYKIQE